MEIIQHLFPNRVIRQFSDIHWSSLLLDRPVHSEDTSNHMYVKGRHFIKKTVEINFNFLNQVDTNFKEKLLFCIYRNDHHINIIIFHT